MSETALPQLLLLREAPAWLAARGVVGYDGRPMGLSTIYGMVKKGRLPVVRLGRTYIPLEALERMVRGEATKPPAREVRTTKQRTTSKQEHKRLERSKEILRQHGIKV